MLFTLKISDHWPSTRIAELAQKKTIPQATYDKIEDQLVVKQK